MFNIPAVLPDLQEVREGRFIHSLPSADVLELVGGELVGEQCQEVLRTGAALGRGGCFCVLDGFAEELHLAPQVVLLAPPDEVLQRLVPLPALRHIEHHGLEEGDIVRSACSGVLLKPYTMIVYESTANGSGNFFQYEYDAAKAHESQFDALFISWFDIDTYYQAFWRHSIEQLSYIMIVTSPGI